MPAARLGEVWSAVSQIRRASVGRETVIAFAVVRAYVAVAEDATLITGLNTVKRHV